MDNARNEKAWYKSSFSGTGNCVEVRMQAEEIHVRDTKDRQGPALTFTIEEWDAFLRGVWAGEFGDPGKREPRRRMFWPARR